VKENYNGTEYLAQGTVNSVNNLNGAVTVASWDSGSIFLPVAILMRPMFSNGKKNMSAFIHLCPVIMMRSTKLV
jgi:hypothetical protein